MHIDVARLWKSDIAITGTFAVDGTQKYFSLELPELYNGVANVTCKTCIPPGTYEVKRLYSPHFQQMMPHIVNVPNRIDIEIHIANVPENILGCMGIGETRINQAEIGNSREAFEEFDDTFQNALAAGETVTITIQ